MNLSAAELKEKIQKVQADLQRMQSAGDNIEKINILSDYLEFLHYELEQAEDGKKA
jgi:Ni,Fe-hydrogenase III component G